METAATSSVAGDAWVGNDVVDLTCAHLPPPHVRFADRVLCEEERWNVRASTEPSRALWSYFACKEAAYKLFVKAERRQLPFAHRQFRVSGDLQTVHSPYGECQLRVASSPTGWCHAVASFGQLVTWRVVRLPAGTDASQAARDAALRLASVSTGIASDELQIVRSPDARRWDGAGPPQLLRGHAPLRLDVSLSHHGRFVAVAACPGSPPS
jgi:phosphopantetheinyl transferase (holo-ACP synthase)